MDYQLYYQTRGLCLLTLVLCGCQAPKDELRATPQVTPHTEVSKAVNKSSVSKASATMDKSAIKEQLEVKLRKALPVGSNRAEIEKWLRSNGHKKFWFTGKDHFDKNYKDYIKEKGYKVSDIGGVYTRLSRDVVYGHEVGYSFAFFLDNKQTLVGAYVGEVGPLKLQRTPGKPTLAEVRVLLKELSYGANPQSVIGWLKKKKIEHSPYRKSVGNALADDSQVVRSKHKPKDLGGIINATIENTSYRFAARVDIFIVFFFDKQHRLIDYSTSEVGTGL